jgi:hypothetical protein
VERVLQAVQKESIDDLEGDSNLWLTEDAIEISKIAFRTWQRAVGKDKTVREMLTLLIRSDKYAIEWSSLRSHLAPSRLQSPNGHSFGTISFSIGTLWAAAYGPPFGDELDLAEETRARALALLNGDLPLMTNESSQPPGARASGRHVVTGPRHALREWVRCPDQTQDHRLIVVGELPRSGLHPVAFVSPGDQSGVWYSQEKPLVFKENIAFAAYLYLGNPSGIGHGEPDFESGLVYKVKLFALEHPWPFKEDKYNRTDFDEATLENELKARRIVAWSPFDKEWELSKGHHSVSRLTPAIDKITIAARSSPTVEPVLVPPAFTRVSPVTVSWVGVGPSVVEVRHAKGRDALVARRTIAGIDGTKRVILSLAPEIPPGVPMNSMIHLKDGPDLYRVKLYPSRPRRFLDPLHELWVNVKMPS